MYTDRIPRLYWGHNEKSHGPPPSVHWPQAVVLSIAAYLPVLSSSSLAGSSGHRHINCDSCYLAGPSLRSQFIFVPSHVPPFKAMVESWLSVWYCQDIHGFLLCKHYYVCAGNLLAFCAILSTFWVGVWWSAESMVDTFLLTCGGGQYQCWWCSWGGVWSYKCLVIFKYWCLTLSRYIAAMCISQVKVRV